MTLSRSNGQSILLRIASCNRRQVILYYYCRFRSVMVKFDRIMQLKAVDTAKEYLG